MDGQKVEQRLATGKPSAGAVNTRLQGLLGGQLDSPCMDCPCQTVRIGDSLSDPK